MLLVVGDLFARWLPEWEARDLALFGGAESCMFVLSEILLWNQSDWNALGIHEVSWVSLTCLIYIPLKPIYFRLPHSLQLKICDRESPRATMSWYGRHPNNSALFLQDLALYGCLPVCVCCAIYVWILTSTYSKGLDACQATFAVKKYRSHRHVGNLSEVLDAINIKRSSQGVGYE